MLRLIERLVKEDLVRSIKTTLTLGETKKQLHFVCVPDLTPADTMVKNAIEQSKVKYFSMPTATKNSTTWFKAMKPFQDDDDDDDDDEDDVDDEDEEKKKSSTSSIVAVVEGDQDGNVVEQKPSILSKSSAQSESRKRKKSGTPPVNC